MPNNNASTSAAVRASPTKKTAAQRWSSLKLVILACRECRRLAVLPEVKMKKSFLAAFEAQVSVKGDERLYSWLNADGREEVRSSAS